MNLLSSIKEDWSILINYYSVYDSSSSLFIVSLSTGSFVFDLCPSIVPSFFRLFDCSGTFDSSTPPFNRFPLFTNLYSSSCLYSMFNSRRRVYLYGVSCCTSSEASIVKNIVDSLIQSCSCLLWVFFHPLSSLCLVLLSLAPYSIILHISLTKQPNCVATFWIPSNPFLIISLCKPSTSTSFILILIGLMALKRHLRIKTVISTLNDQFLSLERWPSPLVLSLRIHYSFKLFSHFLVYFPILYSIERIRWVLITDCLKCRLLLDFLIIYMF